MRSLKYWVAVGFGSGLSPKAPGTTGTLGVLPLVAFAWDAPLVVWVAGFVVLCGLSLWSIQAAGEILGAPDHGQIVIDEWAGMWVAGYALASLTPWAWPLGLLVAFVGFRFFDIVKPWPVSWCEQHIAGPLGVLADDIAAGLYVLLLTLVFAMMAGFLGYL